MNPRPILPWRSALLLAVAVAIAVPIAALALDPGDDDALLVLAPSSLAPIEDELDATLLDAGVGPVEWVFAGSQSLVAQVADGVPADVVLVADRVAFDAVLEAGDGFDREIAFASNHLVLAVAAGNPGAVASVDDLADPERLIGVCAAEVPCGRLAATALAELGIALSPDTEETSARALTAKIASGELDAGLVYVTDARAAGLDIVSEDAFARFENTYHGAGTPAAGPFLDVLAGDEAAGVFADAGFGG